MEIHLYLYFWKNSWMKPGVSIRKISIIGAGNLGSNLAIALSEKGFEITEVYDIDQKAANALANRIGSVTLKSLQNLSLQSDIYILSVSDDNLESITAVLDLEEKLVVHTSGTIQIDVLKKSSRNYGVIYPPQTFSSEHPVSFREIPVCIEANSKKNLQLIRDLVSHLTTVIHPVTERQRRMIHLSAVFAGNFPNFFYSIAEELLSGEGLELRIIRPLIMKTASNSNQKDVFHFQTGPAIREDTEVIQTHLQMLKTHPQYKDLYMSRFQK